MFSKTLGKAVHNLEALVISAHVNQLADVLCGDWVEVCLELHMSVSVDQVDVHLARVIRTRRKGLKAPRDRANLAAMPVSAITPQVQVECLPAGQTDLFSQPWHPKILNPKLTVVA
jgi:hypothetical protein